MFSVEDVHQSRGKADEMGLTAMGPLIELDKEQIRENAGDRFRKFKEYVIRPEDCFGVGVVLGEIEPK